MKRQIYDSFPGAQPRHRGDVDRPGSLDHGRPKRGVLTIADSPMPGMRWVLITLAIALFLGVFAVSAHAQSCPNEELRVAQDDTGLPDCRAYEQVTPTADNGQPPIVNPSATSVAPSGDAISFGSLGAFGDPGNNATVAGGEYIAQRSTNGWQTVPINSSAHEFQDGAGWYGASFETLDYSRNLSETLFLGVPTGGPSLASNFYKRLPANGTDQLIGPAMSPSTLAGYTGAEVAAGQWQAPNVKFAGASEDLRHIFFTIENVFPYPVWPGDTTAGGETTQATSLYEYNYTNQSEPELVAVTNEGTLAEAARADHKSHINEAANLIGQCGAVLGGVPRNGLTSTQDAFNAVADNGEVAFFSVVLSQSCNEIGQSTYYGPPQSEIFARISQRHTVAISEPSATDCSECNDSTPAPAIFQGASRDGARAFFVSQQELFGGSNGESGDNLYEFDLDGPPGGKVKFVSAMLAKGEEFVGAGLGDEGGVMRITESGNRVYFVSTAEIEGTRPNEFGVAPAIGADNLYMYESSGDAITFIARMAESDALEWGAGDLRRRAEATSDGRYLLFTSSGDLTAEATGSTKQLYRYDSERSPTEAAGGVPRLRRISVGALGSYYCPASEATELGYNCDGRTVASDGGFAPTYEHLSAPIYNALAVARPYPVAITADGKRVFFASPAALVPGALNEACAYEVHGKCRTAANNVYEWNDGVVNLISDGGDVQPWFSRSAVQLIGADPSGVNLFFTTADSLLRGDDNNQVDIYDARQNGGDPMQVTPVECEGEGCRGSTNGSPVLPVPAPAVTTRVDGGRKDATTVRAKGTKCSKSRQRKPKHGKCAPNQQRRRKISKGGK